MKHPSNRLKDLSPHFSKWEERRREADTVAEVLRTGTTSHQVRADRIAGCSTFLQLHPLDTANGRQKWIAHTRRCREHFCPICQICRMVMWKVRMQAALRKLLTDYPDAVGIALTFTIRNCAIEDLRDTLKKMSKSWAAMIRRPPWPKHYGWLRVTEVTRGDDGTAHPHYHVLLLVPNQYFQGNDYLNQEQWTALWQRHLQVPYTPRVDVRRVKAKALHTAVSIIERGQRQTAKPDSAQRHTRDTSSDQDHQPPDDGDAWDALCKVLDYDLKPDEVTALSEDADWFLTLTDELTGIRTIEVGGHLRKIKAKVTKDLHQERQRARATVQPKQSTNWIWQGHRYVKAYGGGYGQSLETADGGAEGQTTSHTLRTVRTSRSKRDEQPTKTAGQGRPTKTTSNVTPARLGSPTGTTPHSTPPKQTARRASRPKGSRTGRVGAKPRTNQGATSSSSTGDHQHATRPVRKGVDRAPFASGKMGGEAARLPLDIRPRITKEKSIRYGND